MNYTFLCEARDSNDLLLEHNVCISNMPMIPRLGDKISLLEFPDRAWIGDERLLDNVWPLDTGYGRTTNDKYAHEHPAIYPDILAARHIETWSNKGDIVLDPFMGSGTTAKAAQELGRHYIGFEINPEYVEICQRRTAQTTLGI